VGIVRTRACAALVAAVAAGCGDGWSKYGPFPIGVDLSTGPMLVSAGQGDAAPSTAVIDTMSPVTMVDDFTGGNLVDEQIGQYFDGRHHPIIPARMHCRGLVCPPLFVCGSGLCARIAATMRADRARTAVPVRFSSFSHAV